VDFTVYPGTGSVSGYLNYGGTLRRGTQAVAF